MLFYRNPMIRFSNIFVSLCRCEPFPTYPRTYDMLHANELLTHLSSERCSLMDLFLEMDRILRPEVHTIHFFPITRSQKKQLNDLDLCVIGLIGMGCSKRQIRSNRDGSCTCSSSAVGSTSNRSSRW